MDGLHLHCTSSIACPTLTTWRTAYKLKLPPPCPSPSLEMSYGPWLVDVAMGQVWHEVRPTDFVSDSPCVCCKVSSAYTHEATMGGFRMEHLHPLAREVHMDNKNLATDLMELRHHHPHCPRVSSVSPRWSMKNGNGCNSSTAEICDVCTQHTTPTTCVACIF